MLTSPNVVPIRVIRGKFLQNTSLDNVGPRGELNLSQSQQNELDY